jgi:hypothetical protein
MIFSYTTIEYFRQIEAKAVQAMAKYDAATPYWIADDPVIGHYECLREVWERRKPIKAACIEYQLFRSQYYEMEKQFVRHGLVGLFPRFNGVTQFLNLEKLVLVVKEAKPKISQQAILRIAQAVPLTNSEADADVISAILQSHGIGLSDRSTDKLFWERIQRTSQQLGRLAGQQLQGRDEKQRKETFSADADISHQRLELLRGLFFDRKLKIKEQCLRYNMSLTSFYRLVADYRLFGPWAVISAPLPGKGSASAALELAAIVEKLRQPSCSAQQLVDQFKLCCSSYVVNRIWQRWQLTDKTREPVALDRFVREELQTPRIDIQPVLLTAAYDRYSDQQLLESRRINRHFQVLCRKMSHHAYHVCDPGPLLLAPFVNDLGVVQAFEAYGPPRLRGKELSNMALLNIFRIIGGYRRISHLSNGRDRSVALASGLGMFGSSSRFYEKSVEFKFPQLYKLRCDLVARARDLSLIEAMKIAFDFHFKQFYGSDSEQKGIGKGPAKSGDIVPGFRPHVAWDLANNVIISIAYFHGGVRGTKILEQFCEQNIFPMFDPRAIAEIYMDSEYTKEAALRYFKETVCSNGDVYLCLKQNKQIKKLITPALAQADGWEKFDKDDEKNFIKVILPHSGLPLSIVILRNRTSKKNIRCFGSTDLRITGGDLLRKYQYRWLIENGLKDLVYSYFVDEIYGTDPEKIEFEFYCVMVARMAYEHFLKELGGEYYHDGNGDKTTLTTMRNLLFEKRNCRVEQNAQGDFDLTLLDSSDSKLEKRVSEMLNRWRGKGKNKVLWWQNRGINLRIDGQYHT